MEAWMAFVSVMAIAAIVVVGGGLIAFVAHMVLGVFDHRTPTVKQEVKEGMDYSQYKQLETEKVKTVEKDYDFEAINRVKAQKEKEMLDSQKADIYELDDDFDELAEIENRLKARKIEAEQSQVDVKEETTYQQEQPSRVSEQPKVFTIDDNEVDAIDELNNLANSDESTGLDDDIDDFDFDDMLNEISNDVIEEERSQMDNSVKMSDELASYSIDDILNAEEDFEEDDFYDEFDIPVEPIEEIKQEEKSRKEIKKAVKPEEVKTYKRLENAKPVDKKVETRSEVKAEPKVETRRVENTRPVRRLEDSRTPNVVTRDVIARETVRPAKTESSNEIKRLENARVITPVKQEIANRVEERKIVKTETTPEVKAEPKVEPKVETRKVEERTEVKRLESAKLVAPVKQELVKREEVKPVKTIEEVKIIEDDFFDDFDDYDDFDDFKEIEDIKSAKAEELKQLKSAGTKQYLPNASIKHSEVKKAKALPLYATIEQPRAEQKTKIVKEKVYVDSFESQTRHELATYEIEALKRQLEAVNRQLEEARSGNRHLEELNRKLEEAKNQEPEVIRIDMTEDECVNRIHTLEDRLKSVKKDYKANAKEYRPLRKVMNDLEHYQTKLRRKEAVVAKKKVALYGVNNYVDIDKEKAEKLANELELLDGLRLSVSHCEELIEANKDRFPVLEHTNQILEDQIAHIESDLEVYREMLRRIRERNGNGENGNNEGSSEE